MELNKMIYQVWETLEGLNITDDTLLEYDFIKDKFIAMHPTLVKEAVDAKLPLDGFYQIVNCIEIERVQGSCTFGGVVFQQSDKICRAVLPPLVKTIGRLKIRYLGSNTFGKDIARVSMEGFRHHESNRFTANEPVCVVIGDEAYFKMLPTTAMSLATLVGILSDPTRACDWPADDAGEFPTPSAMRMMIAVTTDILRGMNRPDLIHDSQIALGGGQQKAQPEKGGEE